MGSVADTAGQALCTSAEGQDEGTEIGRNGTFRLEKRNTGTLQMFWEHHVSGFKGAWCLLSLCKSHAQAFAALGSLPEVLPAAAAPAQI